METNYYKLLKKFESPSQVIHPGVIKSRDEWERIFNLEPGDLDIKSDWFEKSLSHEERYPLCQDQPAQIDCRDEKCFHYSQGNCLNISPALTLLPMGKFTCWSFTKNPNENERN
jgi:hypothetical protein